MSAEIHLFILWEKVGHASESVLQRIRSEFDILQVFRVRWSPALFSANLSRFYGQKLPAGCDKEASCGAGLFTLVVVRDSCPEYALRDTTRGTARVNTRSFDLKSFFRSTAGGNLPIHATNTPQEAAHDLALLLGFGPSGFVAAYPGLWNGEIISLRRDLSGAQGWESLAELFTVLNETTGYIVLRNFDGLPEHFQLELHGDIDLLVDNYVDACLATNAMPVFNDPWRVHHTVVIGGTEVPFDFRYLGDNYYDRRWQRCLLDTRKLAPGGFFVPDTENHFYSLLYHATVHKPAVAPDYMKKLALLAQTSGLSLPPDEFFTEPQKVRTFLRRFMKPRGYRFTRPHDPTVYFNPTVALSPVEIIVRRILPTEKQGPPTPQVPTNALMGAGPLFDRTDERLTGTARANLLRPFHFHAGQHILELGCEAGVITRYLGETGATVLAVESVPGLAKMAQEHCSDLANVRVVCDDPVSFETKKKFDVVTLIGTPERTVALDNEPPLDALLMRATRLLNDDGLLILAMGNPLGLKHFNGCPDGPSGIPFFGINDLYKNSAPAPFGRQILVRKLARAGFGNIEFLFPFPDYQLPGLILSAAALEEPRLNIADLLIPHTGRIYPETHHRAFAEDLAWRTVINNGLLADLANSFLILARKNRTAIPPTDWLAKMFSRGHRRPIYQIESSIEHSGDGRLIVRKRRLFPDAAGKASPWLRQFTSDSDYLSGNLCIAQVHRAMAREAGLDELAACFASWLKFLLTQAITDPSGTYWLPGDFVDCIPTNMIETNIGELHYFDAEWVSDKPIPLSWIVIRGVIYSLSGCLENSTLLTETYRQFTTGIAKRNHINLSPTDFTTADQLERQIVEQCHTDHDTIPRLADFLDNPLFLTVRLAQHSTDYQRSLAWHQAELARVKKTVSWRSTALLRVIWNLLLRLVSMFRINR